MFSQGHLSLGRRGNRLALAYGYTSPNPVMSPRAAVATSESTLPFSRPSPAQEVRSASIPGAAPFTSLVVRKQPPVSQTRYRGLNLSADLRNVAGDSDLQIYATNAFSYSALDSFFCHNSYVVEVCRPAARYASQDPVHLFLVFISHPPSPVTRWSLGDSALVPSVARGPSPTSIAGHCGVSASCRSSVSPQA